MNTEHELFGEHHEQEENGLFGNEHKRQHEAQQEVLRLSAVVGQSEQSCKHPDSCAMGYYHQIGDYYCSKCQKTGLKD